MPNITENQVTLLKCTSTPIDQINVNNYNDTISACDGNINCKYATYDSTPTQKTATLYDESCINNYLDNTQYLDSDNKYTYNKDYANLADPEWLTLKINNMINGIDLNDNKCPTHIPGIDMLLKSIDYNVLLGSTDYPIIGNDPGNNFDTNAFIRLNNIVKDINTNPDKYQNVDPNIVKLIQNCFTDRTTYGTHDNNNVYNIIKGTDSTNVCYTFDSVDKRNHFMTFLGDNIEGSTCHSVVSLTTTEKQIYDMAKNIVDKVWERINDFVNDSGNPIIPTDPDTKKMWIQQHFHHGVHNKTISMLNNKVNGNLDKRINGLPANNNGYYLFDNNDRSLWRGPPLNTIGNERGVSDDDKNTASALFNSTTNSEGIKFLKCNEPDMVNKTPHAFNILKVATMLISWGAIKKRLGPRAALDILKSKYPSTDEPLIEPFVSRQNIPTDLLLDINYGIQTGLNKSGQKIDKNKLIKVVSNYGIDNINNTSILEVLSGF